MIKNQNIICISSIDWNFNWQGHQEIMHTFAACGNRVLFIENTGVRFPTLKDMPRIWRKFLNWRKGIMGIRKEENNLYVFSPIAIPFPYSRIARIINRYLFISSLKNWIEVMDFFEPIIWTFLPTGTALEIIKNIDKKLVVYYCIADFAELVRQPKKIRRTEEQLLKRCDLVFAQGDEIAVKCRKYNNNVAIFPFGVNLSLFEAYRKGNNDIPSDLKAINKPIVGYVGALHKHFDFELIMYLAEKNPELSFVLVGPKVEDIKELKKFNNIFLLGEKEHYLLPAYINNFDICVIPYVITKYTETVYPTKLNEYLIMGKPVVSVSLPEVINFNAEHPDIVLIAKDREEFNIHVRKAIMEKKPFLVQKRIEAARANSWENRLEQMSLHLEEKIRQKELLREEEWRRVWLLFFRALRIKISYLICISFILYSVIFYSPLIWLLGRPLKISQVPQKTDAIVVFSGGVGESGKAGQGYEERVAWAVELYKKDYSENMIFSSGYKYKFKESQIMKALAVSLGVPEESIYLEENAANTYENVKFTKQVIYAKKWHSILLVSSPYHMLRASLVFKKIAPDIKVIYTPIPKSIFYERERKVKLSQMKGVLHEYLGIVYYFLKGHI